MNAPSSDEEDSKDMQRLVAGHDRSLNALMDRHGLRLFHYLFRSLNDDADATDLAQETFCRVYQNRQKFRSTEKFSTWLYTIATNLMRDRFRWRERHPQVSLDAVEEESGPGFAEQFSEEQVTPSEALIAGERADHVRQAIQALPDELRTPLILSEYEERSHAEIAAILNCSAKAVETRLYRARNQLRKALASVLPTL